MNGADQNIIQSLWIGDRLSVMEQLSIRSFLANGHSYHLYTYGNVQDVPDGTVIRDANEILPESAIFRYYEHDSVAGFANFFRYKLLLDKGGWWSDTDVVCLKPFDFDDSYVFSSQHDQFLTGEQVCVGVLKAPPGSDFARYLWDVCKSKDTRTLRWGETGPDLTQVAVKKFGLDRYACSAAAFCPVPFKTWQDLLAGDRTWEFGDETYGVHLWNELWRREGVDKNAVHAKDCLYERLKRQFGLGPSIE